MIQIHLKGGVASILALVVAVLLALLALTAGLVFLLPVALLALGVALLKGLLGAPAGAPPSTRRGGTRRLPASEAVVEVTPVEAPRVNASNEGDGAD
jgi:hypothetical protein